MSVIDGRAKLVDATKTLTAEWLDVKEIWQDANCQAFEKRYMAPLETGVRGTVVAMERMAAMLNRARHECKGRD